MKKSISLILSTLMLVFTNSCDHLETIPLSGQNINMDTLDSSKLKPDRFFSYNSDEKFGEVPPSTIRVSESTKSSSISYIDCSTKTYFTELKSKPANSTGAKLLKWLGFIISIVSFIIGLLILFSLKKESGSKIKVYTTIFLLILPLLLFFIFVDYPQLFLILWFIMLLPLLAFGTFDESIIYALSFILFISIFIGICGYKAGSKVYFDNASSKNVIIKIDGKYIGELPSMHYTKLRLSGMEPKIEVLNGDTIIETVYLPINRNYKVLIKQSLLPWSNYIYNINGQNSYKENSVNYY